jgi:2-polyprenyl-6-methoxyphenol hydroxylase-like FAD-dependent oxidoreductase
MAEIGRILIVGGGIAGLTLATALQRRGFAPELVERRPTWDAIAIGAGIGVQPNGMRVMHGSRHRGARVGQSAVELLRPAG